MLAKANLRVLSNCEAGVESTGHFASFLVMSFHSFDPPQPSQMCEVNDITKDVRLDPG